MMLLSSACSLWPPAPPWQRCPPLVPGRALLSARFGLSPGTSLLQEVVYLVSQGADPDEIGLMNIDEQLPVLEYPQPGLDIIKVLPGGGQPLATTPCALQSHLLSGSGC